MDGGEGGREQGRDCGSNAVREGGSGSEGSPEMEG